MSEWSVRTRAETLGCRDGASDDPAAPGEFVIEDILVCTRFPARIRPDELHLSLEGRVWKHAVAAWDGCAYLI